MSARPWPTELRFKSADKVLQVKFEDGRAFAIPFETLRTESPSAEVQGHNPGEKRTITGKQDVQVTAAEPVGRYAVRLVFDDGHDSGLFTWDYLYALGESAG
ncbi:gamma-butyrobetaine hydroxylase family protein [Maricaulis sp. CAU 1757]